MKMSVLISRAQEKFVCRCTHVTSHFSPIPRITIILPLTINGPLANLDLLVQTMKPPGSFLQFLLRSVPNLLQNALAFLQARTSLLAQLKIMPDLRNAHAAAAGHTGKYITRKMQSMEDVQLTFFVRNPAKFEGMDMTGVQIIQGDALNADDVKKAMAGQDILLCSLEGDVLTMAKSRPFTSIP